MSHPCRKVTVRSSRTHARGRNVKLKLGDTDPESLEHGQGAEFYLRTGEYLDGRLGEIFFDFDKLSVPFQGLFDCLAVAVSVALQYGAPLDKLVDKFRHTRFEPEGACVAPYGIKYATSIVDLAFRVLEQAYKKKAT